jgi:hypothetical protein
MSRAAIRYFQNTVAAYLTLSSSLARCRRTADRLHWADGDWTVVYGF